MVSLGAPDCMVKCDFPAGFPRSAKKRESGQVDCGLRRYFSTEIDRVCNVNTKRGPAIVYTALVQDTFRAGIDTKKTLYGVPIRLPVRSVSVSLSGAKCHERKSAGFFCL